jgi:hypothetical protein
MSNIIEIEIIDFKNIYPRPDREPAKSMPWFRMDTHFLDSDQLFGFTHSELVLTWALFSNAAKLNNSTIPVYINVLVQKYKISEKDIASGLNKLVKNQVIRPVGRKLAEIGGSCRKLAVRGEERRGDNICPILSESDDILIGINSKKKTPNKNNDPILVQKIEFIYKEHYPRKEGKTRGIKVLLKDLQENELELFEKSVMNYKSHCLAQNTEYQYTKIFSTFAAEWRDWVDYQQVDKSEVKQKPNNSFPKIVMRDF